MKAAVLLKTDEAMREELRAKCPGAEFCWDAKPDAETIGEYDVIIGNVDPALLRYAASLKLLQLNTAGVDAYADRSRYANPGTVVCNAAGAYGLVLSEYMTAVHLALLKNLHLYRDSMGKRAWEPIDGVGTVFGSRVLVLGAGDIGKAYARCVRPMGAYCIGLRRHAGELPEFDETHTMDALDALLPTADAVVMVLPGTKETEGVMTRERLFAMKKGAVLINAGRGSAIDQKALYDVLKCGHLKGAAIDVTVPEPLPEDDPLWTLENLIITPHSAGGLRVRYTVQKILQLAALSIRELQDGKPVTRQLDLTRGY